MPGQASVSSCICVCQSLSLQFILTKTGKKLAVSQPDAADPWLPDPWHRYLEVKILVRFYTWPASLMSVEGNKRVEGTTRTENET